MPPEQPTSPAPSGVWLLPSSGARRPSRPPPVALTGPMSQASPALPEAPLWDSDVRGTWCWNG